MFSRQSSDARSKPEPAQGAPGAGQGRYSVGILAWVAAVGRFIAAGVDWRTGQAINAGRPTADWPDGRPVLTTTPEAYADWGVEPIVAT